MKIMLQLLCVTMMLGGLMLAGCAKKADVNTSGLESSFKSAEADAKGAVDKVVTAVKSADYQSALSELQNLAKNAKLTPEQKQSIEDVLGQVQKAITGAAAKVGGDASKAVDSATKALPK